MQKIRIANCFDHGSVKPRPQRKQPVHGLVGPLHSLLVIDGQHRILHAVQQGFQLALAGSQGGKVSFELAGGLVQGGRQLANLVSRSLADACREIPRGNLFGKLQDLLETPTGVLGRNSCHQESH